MNARVTRLPEYTPQNWDAEVGKRIKELLIGRATQEQLASLLALGQTDISKRLNGRVSWKGRELGDIAEALGVSVSVLYGEDRKSPTPVGAGLKKLPDLDSNQEPAGFKPAPETRAPERLRPVVRLADRRSPGRANHPAGRGIVLPFHGRAGA